MSTEGTLLGHILEEPIWLQAWVFWMGLVNTASILFVARREGWVTLAVWIGNGLFMMWLFELAGYVRLLGLSHVIFWTPLLGYLYHRLPNLPRRSATGAWVRVLIATNAVSLVIDYLDVIRYLLGDTV